MRIVSALLALFLLTGCITVETKTPPPPQFVTSTLPALPAVTPSRTATPPSAATLPRPANCKDAAVLIQDVTFPDGTHVARGQAFTKTWRLRNTGTCPWDGHYRLAFAKGERLGAPDFIPFLVTAPKADMDISVELTAPATDGSYTGYYVLRNPSGENVPIGLEKSIWVKIIVGEAAPTDALPGSTTIPPAVGPTTIGGGVTPVRTAASCGFSANAGYVNQLLTMINDARRQAKLPALVVNAQLTAAAQGHSQDMACNNFLGHTGSNGSDIGSRIVAAGYAPSRYLEIIAIGTPQDAMNQWQADAPHWEAVLNAGVTEIGIGYAYYAQSDLGGYFTVDFGSQ
jgi:uncharacterized protein YkwD